MFLDLCLKNLTLVKEINTEYTFVCPVCKESKLKINKLTEKYWCYANNCKSSLIYKEIVRNDRFYNENRFKSKIKTKKVNYSIFDNVPIKSTKLSRSYIDNLKVYTDTINNKCTYYYNKCIKLVRTDTLEGKVYTPYYKDYFDEDWKIGNNGQFDFYLPIKFEDEGIIFCVEGEKCTVELVKKGITAFNIYQPHSSNQQKIKEILTNLSSRYSFIFDYGVIYICDNDKIGELKGKKFVEVCNYLGIPNKLLTMQDILSFFSVQRVLTSGYDIADFIKDYTEIDLCKLEIGVL